MNQQQLQDIVLSTTFTKADYLRRVRTLREFLEQRFFSGLDISFPDYLAKINSSQHERETLVNWTEEFFSYFTPDNLYKLIESLKEGLKLLPVVVFYSAVILDDYQVDELGKWFRLNLSPILILDMRCSPGIISGCAYVWTGKYHDLSLHHLFSNKQEIIAKIIESYAKI